MLAKQFSQKKDTKVHTQKSFFNFIRQEPSNNFFKATPAQPAHTNGQINIQKQEDRSTPSTPCATAVSIGSLAQFNHSNLPAAQKDDWGTYLGVTSQMNVGPGPDHTGHCMKETLTTISNTCPEQVYNRDGNVSSPCSGNKCLAINRYGSAGDAATRSLLSDGPTSFIDLHRTRFRTSLLEGSGVDACSVVCQQTYACDRTNTATGNFRITRNFQADTHTKADGTSVPITTGNIVKEEIPTTP